MKKVISLLVMLSLLIAFPVQAEVERGIQDELIYDILVDRFNIGNLSLNENVRKDDPFAYQGGDLIGITKKLDRIKDLGFTAIQLSPVMKNAPDGYHGYWIEDFFEVNEQFGSMEDLKELIAEAHKRDIKVILELVTNYVSLTHPFVADPDKSDWFKENTVETAPGTEWLNNVAVLDQENKEVESYLLDVAEFWVDETGIDGFKLNDIDVSSESFLTTLTAHLKDHKSDIYLLAGLSAHADETNFDQYQAIQAVENKMKFEKMNDVFTEADQPVTMLYDTWLESGDKPSILYVDNKNTARFSNNFAEKGRNALTTWKLTLAYMYTTPGIPTIYQGSELPMYGPSFKEGQMLVQFNSTNPEIEEYYDRISSLRREFKPLSHGDFELIGSNEAMSLFKRTFEGETMYIAINNASTDQAVAITDLESGHQLRGLLGDNLVRENQNGEYKINVARESAEVYIIEEDTGLNWLFIGFIVGVFVLFAGFIVLLTRKQKKA